MSLTAEVAALRYKRGPRFGLDEETQSWIYWQLQNVARLPVREQQKIRKIVVECTPIDADRAALLEALTTKNRLLDIATAHYREERDLYYLVRRFFREYAECKKNTGT